MTRKPKPPGLTLAGLYRLMLAAGAPCRQKTQECLHTGDCALCGAWTGEACLAPRFEASAP